MKKSNFSHCGIPGKLLREISTSVSFFMSRHFNNLFEVGYFPEIWKITHVTAIYKKFGPKTCKTSYRPISPLSTMSKVFESVIHDRLSKHCTENYSISEKHAAYLKGDSTVSQLLYIVHNIREKNTAKRNMSSAVFVCACMCSAAYVIFIMWNSISGLDTCYHFRLNISCGVAVTVGGHPKKHQVNF